MKKLSAGLTYANVVSTICLFLLLGGGAAFAATQLPKNSVGPKQIRNGAVTQAKIAPAAQAALRGATGAPGARGETGPRGETGLRGEAGARGETGPRGLVGPVGPTEGFSFGDDLAWAPELEFGSPEETLTAGKLFAFGHVESAEVSCTAGATVVESALFIDGVLVPGTSWEMAAGVKKTLDFSGVTAASIPAGKPKLAWGARCLGPGVVAGMTPGIFGFGFVVLG
jgi:hypothetical protein